MAPGWGEGPSNIYVMIIKDVVISAALTTLSELVVLDISGHRPAG